MDQENLDSTELHQIEIGSPNALEKNPSNFPKKLQFSCSPTCSFSNQEFNKSDAAERSKTTYKLLGLIFFYTIVMVIEIVGGLRANSLAILTDAAHLLSDIAGFFISLFTVWVSGWKATPQQSFGFNRFEVIGALLSVQLIWLVSGTLIYEAIDRLVTKSSKVNGKLMFGISAFGFVVNFILVLWLGHNHSHHDHDHSHHDHSHHDHSRHVHSHHDHSHHDHKSEESCVEHGDEEENMTLVAIPHGKRTEMLNINIQGAYLHLMTDLIQSVGVMIAGSIIWMKPDWLIVDLICTLMFSTLALCTTLPMLKSIFSILMERAPSDIDIVRIENDFKLIGGVRDVHDLHVWAITVGKNVLACHVVIEPEANSNEILHKIREHCEQNFGIHHVTVQIEQEL